MSRSFFSATGKICDESSSSFMDDPTRDLADRSDFKLSGLTQKPKASIKNVERKKKPVDAPDTKTRIFGSTETQVQKSNRDDGKDGNPPRVVKADKGCQDYNPITHEPRGLRGVKTGNK